MFLMRSKSACHEESGMHDRRGISEWHSGEPAEFLPGRGCRGGPGVRGFLSTVLAVALLLLLSGATAGMQEEVSGGAPAGNGTSLQGASETPHQSKTGAAYDLLREGKELFEQGRYADSLKRLEPASERFTAVGDYILL